MITTNHTTHDTPVPRDVLDDYAHAHSGDPDTFPELRDDPEAVTRRALERRTWFNLREMFARFDPSSFAAANHRADEMKG